jgi:hypothetical protein
MSEFAKILERPIKQVDFSEARVGTDESLRGYSLLELMLEGQVGVEETLTALRAIPREVTEIVVRNKASELEQSLLSLGTMTTGNFQVIAGVVQQQEMLRHLSGALGLPELDLKSKITMSSEEGIGWHRSGFGREQVIAKPYFPSKSGLQHDVFAHGVAMEVLADIGIIRPEAISQADEAMVRGIERAALSCHQRGNSEEPEKFLDQQIERLMSQISPHIEIKKSSASGFGCDLSNRVELLCTLMAKHGVFSPEASERAVENFSKFFQTDGTLTIEVYSSGNDVLRNLEPSVVLRLKELVSSINHMTRQMVDTGWVDFNLP